MNDLTDLLSRLRDQRPVEWEQLPDFSLYMDQVLSYMDARHKKNGTLPAEPVGGQRPHPHGGLQRRQRQNRRRAGGAAPYGKRNEKIGLAYTGRGVV